MKEQRNALELYQIQSKENIQNDNIDAPSRIITPFNCIKEESCCWFHRRWYDESKQTLIVGRGVIHHQYSPESCLLDFGRSSYCYKKSEPWSANKKHLITTIVTWERRSCCFRLNLCLALPNNSTCTDDGCGFRKNHWFFPNLRRGQM